MSAQAGQEVPMEHTNGAGGSAEGEVPQAAASGPQQGQGPGAGAGVGQGRERSQSQVQAPPPETKDDEEWRGADHPAGDIVKKSTIKGHVEASPQGRYLRFDEKLGTGQYKVVYRAYDTSEGIEVAWNTVNIKNLPKEEKRRIMNEVRLLQNLSHKNLVQFHGSWVNRDKEEVIFVTEIMQSGSLFDFITRVEVIRWRVVKRWARQILKGLNYLHTQEPPIIHRDLKCDNIFINGNSGDIRIGDLGLSTSNTRSEKTMSVLGTPEFMAPELYEEYYTEKVDIYAFGMCMLEMVTKERPYSECLNAAQIYRKVTSQILPSVLDNVDNTRAREFIRNCLNHDPNKRPSAQELLNNPFLKDKNEEEDNAFVKLMDAGGAAHAAAVELAPQAAAGLPLSPSRNSGLLSRPAQRGTPGLEPIIEVSSAASAAAVAAQSVQQASHGPGPGPSSLPGPGPGPGPGDGLGSASPPPQGAPPATAVAAAAATASASAAAAAAPPGPAAPAPAPPAASVSPAAPPLAVAATAAPPPAPPAGAGGGVKEPDPAGSGPAGGDGSDTGSLPPTPGLAQVPSFSWSLDGSTGTASDVAGEESLGSGPDGGKALAGSSGGKGSSTGGSRRESELGSDGDGEGRGRMPTDSGGARDDSPPSKQQQQQQQPPLQQPREIPREPYEYAEGGPENDNDHEELLNAMPGDERGIGVLNLPDGRVERDEDTDDEGGDGGGGGGAAGEGDGGGGAGPREADRASEGTKGERGGEAAGGVVASPPAGEGSPEADAAGPRARSAGVSGRATDEGNGGRGGGAGDEEGAGRQRKPPESYLAAPTAATVQGGNGGAWGEGSPGGASPGSPAPPSAKEVAEPQAPGVAGSGAGSAGAATTAPEPHPRRQGEGASAAAVVAVVPAVVLPPSPPITSPPAVPLGPAPPPPPDAEQEGRGGQDGFARSRSLSPLAHSLEEIPPADDRAVSPFQSCPGGIELASRLGGHSVGESLPVGEGEGSRGFSSGPVAGAGRGSSWHDGGFQVAPDTSVPGSEEVEPTAPEDWAPTEIKFASAQGPERDVMRLVMRVHVDGRLQEVAFAFNLEHDDPHEVSREMVSELSLPDTELEQITMTIAALAEKARRRRLKHSPSGNNLVAVTGSQGLGALMSDDGSPSQSTSPSLSVATLPQTSSEISMGSVYGAWSHMVQGGTATAVGMPLTPLSQGLPAQAYGMELYGVKEKEMASALSNPNIAASGMVVSLPEFMSNPGVGAEEAGVEYVGCGDIEEEDVEEDRGDDDDSSEDEVEEDAEFVKAKQQHDRKKRQAEKAYETRLASLQVARGERMEEHKRMLERFRKDCDEFSRKEEKLVIERSRRMKEIGVELKGLEDRHRQHRKDAKNAKRNQAAVNVPPGQTPAQTVEQQQPPPQQQQQQQHQAVAALGSSLPRELPPTHPSAAHGNGTGADPAAGVGLVAVSGGLPLVRSSSMDGSTAVETAGLDLGGEEGSAGTGGGGGSVGGSVGSAGSTTTVGAGGSSGGGGGGGDGASLGSGVQQPFQRRSSGGSTGSSTGGFALTTGEDTLHGHGIGHNPTPHQGQVLGSTPSPATTQEERGLRERLDTA